MKNNYNIDDYISDATALENKDHIEVMKRLSSESMIRMLHASMGMVTEAGELADMLKKHIFYGKEVDKTNAIEEAGDVLWYLAVLLDTLGVSFEEVMEKNIAKLRARYPDKFTKDDAINRDLKVEREILEK